MATRILGALDIGTQTTTLAAGEVVDGQLKVLRVVSVPTYGVKKGVIRNIGEVTQTIRKAALEMAKQGLDLYDVTTSFSAQGITTACRKGSKSFVSLAVMTEEDAEEAQEMAFSVESADSSNVSLQRFQQRFRVNDQSVESPVGMKGNSLEASVLEMLAPRTAVEALHTAITQAGMHTTETVFSGCADATTVLDAQTRSDGALVINFGAGTCDYLAIANRIVVAAGTLGIGGHHLTNDLAQAFQVNQDVAERMKIDCGAAQIQPDLANERYSLRSTFSAERTVSMHAIQTVTTERVNETLHLLRDILCKQGVYLSDLHGGVWLTGGTAALPNIVDQVSAVLECPCRIGVPLNLVSLPEEAQKAPYRYATVVGLLQYRMRTLASEIDKPSFFTRMRTFFRG
ncbi:MAG: cell division protein FtsA [Kiritimatiellae bacterium]|nr:cell division protein FtsA [Kiritimatiellia bacterium]